MHDLYGGWKKVPDESRVFIAELFDKELDENVYQEHRDKEAAIKKQLLKFSEKYPGVLNEGNIKEIINNKLEENEAHTKK